jgi:hypothetical protein
MSLCILNQDGASLMHRNRPAGPDAFLKAMAPSREDLVVCVACLFPWYWRADLCAREGLPCVLGHALSMQAIHGGKANNAKSDAPKMAVRRRGGRRPHAYVSPAAMRATRDLRRMPLGRKRAELLTHIPQTHGQYHGPAIGTKIAYQATRGGVAERFPAPAVPKRSEVALARLDSDAQLLRDLALAMVTTAKKQDANPLSLLQTVPGIGTILSRVLLDAMHGLARFPRVQDGVSSCRFVTCAKASAGKR